MYGMRLLDTPNDQAPNGAAIETTCRLEIIPKTTACHKYLPSLSTTCHVNPKKETKGLKTSFLTRLFCPGKVANLKGGHCMDHPQTPTWQSRMAPLQGTHGTPTLYLDFLRGAYDTLKPIIWTIPSLVRICCSDPTLAT